MENELSQFIDSLPDIVWTALPDGRIDQLNQRWLDYTGLAVEAGHGRGWLAVVHPEDAPQLVERWQSILDSGLAGEMEARFRDRAGRFRWFLLRVRPSVDASNQIVKWYGISTEVDHRISADSTHHVQWWLSSDGLESHFRSVADSIPALAALLRPSGEIEVVNRQTLDYFGVSLVQLKSGTIPDLIHVDDRARAPRRNLDDSSGAFDFELRLRRSDGVYRWFKTRAFPLRDPDGKIVLWYLLQTDVDDIKRAEALLAGEKRVLEMVTRGQSLADVLDELCRLVEFTLVGSRCSVLLVSPSDDRFLPPIAPNLPGSFVERIAGSSLTRDDSPGALAARMNELVIVGDLAAENRWEGTHWTSAAVSHGLKACWSIPIISTGKKVLGAVELYFSEPGLPTSVQLGLIERFIDLASIVIDRTQHEHELKRSEAFLAEAQRVSSTGSFSWRVDSNEITWSEELYRMFEIDRGNPMTPELTDLRVHPEDLPQLYERVNQARCDGKDFEHDYRLRMPDGSIKFMHTVFHRNQDEAGQIEFVGAIQDVTQRKLADDALATARSDLAHVARVSTLGQLTASIAHEVNQPLAGIITNASTCLRMLAADPPNVDGARETARRTIRDGHRAADVVTRLRALFGKRTESNMPVDLNDVTREVIALSMREIQRDRVFLKLELANDLPPIRGDRVQLQQVILNLILNACEAMRGVEESARELMIATEQEDGVRVRLSVRDMGVGLNDQVSERMFDAFYTTKSDGMGIGLSVSRSIVESHRGRLWAVTNDGPGATFSLSIPCNGVDESSARIVDSPALTPAKGVSATSVRSLG